MSDVSPAPEPRVAPRRVSGDTVTVGCKLPNGLVLQLFKADDFSEPVFGGGSRLGKIWRRTGTPYVLNGPAVNLAEIGKGNLPDYQIVGGYALTAGIPRDVWELWLKQNADTELVRNNIVFAAKGIDDARARAIEQREVSTGLEPIDPDKPPSDVRRVQRDRRNADTDADNL